MAEEKCTHASPVLVPFSNGFSFVCNKCLGRGNGACYTCHSQCDYHLHKECHTTTMTKQMCTHKSLVLLNFPDEVQYTCDGCQEPGKGACYSCHIQCNYVLHRECQTGELYKSHPFFQGMRFVFEQNAPQNILFCEACGVKVKGWRYVLDCGTNTGNSPVALHPCCMDLPYLIEMNSGKTMFIQSYKKPERLNLCCAICRQQGKEYEGWSYFSDKFDVAFHFKCIIKKMQQAQNLQENCSSVKCNTPPPQYQAQSAPALQHHCQTQNPRRRHRKRDVIFKVGANLVLSAVGLDGPWDILADLVSDMASHI